MSLDQYRTAGFNVADSGVEELRAIDIVHEMTREQHDRPSPRCQIERSDVGQDCLDTIELSELFKHRWSVVDTGHRVAKLDEVPRDASSAAAELQDLGSSRDRSMDELRF